MQHQPKLLLNQQLPLRAIPPRDSEQSALSSISSLPLPPSSTHNHAATASRAAPPTPTTPTTPPAPIVACGAPPVAVDVAARADEFIPATALLIHADAFAVTLASWLCIALDMLDRAAAADVSEDILASRLLSPAVTVAGRMSVIVSMLLSEDASAARDWTALMMDPTSLTIELGVAELVAWPWAVAVRRARRIGKRKCMMMCYRLVPGDEIG